MLKVGWPKVILKLNMAASMALIKNTLEGENRSVMEKMAKSNVPAIKPSCTEDVMEPIAEGKICSSRTKSGITALAANQSDVQANCEKTINGKINFSFGLNITAKLIFYISILFLSA